MKRLHKELIRNWVDTRYEVDKKYPWGFLFSYLGTYPASLFCKFNISANKVTIISLFSLLPGFLLMPNYWVGLYFNYGSFLILLMAILQDSHLLQVNLVIT